MLKGMAVLAFAIAVLATVGCKNSDYPVGSMGTVQFGRDSLGVAGSVPVSPTTVKVGNTVMTIIGKTKEMDGDWLVPEGSPRDTWIPLNNVLLFQLN